MCVTFEQRNTALVVVGRNQIDIHYNSVTHYHCRWGGEEEEEEGGGAVYSPPHRGGGGW